MFKLEDEFDEETQSYVKPDINVYDPIGRLVANDISNADVTYKEVTYVSILVSEAIKEGKSEEDAFKKLSKLIFQEILDYKIENVLPDNNVIKRFVTELSLEEIFIENGQKCSILSNHIIVWARPLRMRLHKPR